MDFDDLLLNTYVLFKNNEDVRHKYGERFQYIFIDESDRKLNFAMRAKVFN